jgi:hypothetical protein
MKKITRNLSIAALSIASLGALIVPLALETGSAIASQAPSSKSGAEATPLNS